MGDKEEAEVVDRSDVDPERNEPELSVDDARQVLVQEQLVRLKECHAALREPHAQINQVLQEYNCVQVVEGQLPSGAWVPVPDLGFVDVRIRIAPK